MKKNILKPFLFVCLGLTLTTIVFASVRTLPHVPDPPGTPVVTNIWHFGCTIEYEAPKYEGEAPVTSYIIEYRVIGSGKLWKRSGISQGLEYTTNDMVEGTEAEFRVRAVSKVGESDPSKPCSPVLFINPPL